MNTNRDDLEERYNLLSDVKITRLLKTGNLTDLAKSVALSELKIRRLLIPDFDVKDSETQEIVELQSNMKIIVNHLSQIEATILSGLLQAQGVHADNGDLYLIQTTSPFPSAFDNA